MTTVRQLYELQEVDVEIAHCYSLISSIDSQLGDRAALEALKEEIDGQKACLHELGLQRRAQNLDSESLREKVHDLEGKLYSGTITNLRELEGFEKEATFARGHLRELDEKLLETMVALDEAQEKLHSLEENCRKDEEQWRVIQTNLTKERKELGETLETLGARRQGLISRVGEQELDLYEALRQSKSGLAIAKVERGMCRGCRMALPTHQLQRVRTAREPVLCNSCGRILFVS